MNVDSGNGQNTNSNHNTNSNSNNSNAVQSGNGNDLMSNILGALSGNASGGHNEGDITTLTNLGYTRSQAMQALTACGGNVEMAASFLFQSTGGGGFGF